MGLKEAKNLIDEYFASCDKKKASDFASARQANTQNNQKSSGQNTQKKGGCYVATCVYGSYDCPEVWTLRRFRDKDLAKVWYGRVFIYVYYVISPTLVKWFGDTKWFKRFRRGSLDKMVSALVEKGYESSPYEDKECKM